MKINYLIGDATAPQVSGNKVIAHVCNNVGGWGAGFVLAISRKWRAPETAYRLWHSTGKKSGSDFKLGETQLVKIDGTDITVANMVAQDGLGHGGPPIRYDSLEQCLMQLVKHCTDQKASVHMPRIGCGLAGGTWDKVEPIIERTLIDAQIPTYVYDLPAQINERATLFDRMMNTMEDDDIEYLKRCMEMKLIVWWRSNNHWEIVQSIGRHPEEELPVGYLKERPGQYIALSACPVEDIMITSGNIAAFPRKA